MDRTDRIERGAKRAREEERSPQAAATAAGLSTISTIVEPPTNTISAVLQISEPDDNTTWGMPLRGIPDHSEATAFAEKLYKCFVQRGMISITNKAHDMSFLVCEVLDPETKAFSKRHIQQPTRVNLQELLMSLNNNKDSRTMPLISRDAHINKLNQVMDRDFSDKTVLVPVVSAMGTGKTQLLKRFLGVNLKEACEDGAVIVVECSLGNENSAILQSSLSKENEAELITAVNTIIQRHLEKYFAAELPTATGQTAAQKWFNLVAPRYLPVLALDSANELFTRRLDSISKKTGAPKQRSALEVVAHNLPSQIRVIAAATVPTEFVKESMSNGSDYVLAEIIPPLEVLNKEDYMKACDESWGVKLTDYDKKYSVPLFYYLGGGFPRHLRASVATVSFPAVQILGTAWPAAVEGMYDSAKMYIPLAVKEEFKEGELWTVALVAATKFPVQYSDTVVGHAVRYADVAPFCVATDGASLRMPPVFVKGLLDKNLMGPQPPGWPKGLELTELYKPFTTPDLLQSASPPQTKRGHPYEAIVAHSLVGRWWLLHRSGAGSVTLDQLLCYEGDEFLSEYVVDLSGGLVREAEKQNRTEEITNQLVWHLKADGSGRTATHDMMLPVQGPQGILQYVPIQVRHGSAKTTDELRKQLSDVFANDYPALLVIHQRQYNVGQHGKRCTIKNNEGKQTELMYVDGGAFSRDELVYALAPLTQPKN